MRPPKVNLDQWLSFKTVIDEGSFAKAAEALNKSQSSISYNIAKLEENLPTPVLEMQGRKAVLTAEGKVLYRRANQLLEMASEVEQIAECLAQGWDTEITINADSIVPIKPLLTAIEKFTIQAPQTRITLLENTLSGSTEVLLEKRADIVISGQTPPGFMGTKLTTIYMIPVAHANHPLNRLKQKVTSHDLKQHRQIVVRDSGVKRNQDTGWLDAEQRLTVSHFTQSIQSVRAGLGFAFVPLHYANEFINNGEFKRLDLAENGEREISIYLTLATADREGLAVKAMRDNLVSAFHST